MLAQKYAALNGCLIHTLGYLEMRLILSHFIEFLILGALPKSFISDFILKNGRTPYKGYGLWTIQLIQNRAVDVNIVTKMM